MNEQLMYRLNEIFYSLITEQRQVNKQSYYEKIQKDNPDYSATSINIYANQYTLRQDRLNYLVEEYNDIIKKLYKED